MTAPPIVLLTDFGLSDAYVGMMRGVIHGINPAAHVIDLTHGIGPQDVRHGAVVLADSYRYFPAGSIFVAVVDPGVGTDRAAVLLETPAARFVAPDNGLLTLVCRHYAASFGDTTQPGLAPVPAACRAWRLTNPEYWRQPVSATFHGRDVFAPVAAHLSMDAPPDALGEPTPAINALSLPIPEPEGNTIRGQVVFAEHQGSRAEGIGFGDVGAGFKIVAVDFRDHVGPGDVQVFVATFVVGAAEVCRPQASRLNLCSHRSVDDQNPTFQERFQCINPF